MTLNNSAATSGTNPNYMIVDVNHDSENTGQTNCYDLMSVDCVAYYQFSNIWPYCYWRNSLMRSYLNSTFKQGFSSNIQGHLIAMKYKSETTWYNDDYIILPAVSEFPKGAYVNSSLILVENEGTMYPIFPKWFKTAAGSTSNLCEYIFRTRATSATEDIALISGTGQISSYNGSLIWNAPILFRVQ